MKKRYALGWFAAGAVLGPVLFGAISPLFWSYGSHGATAPEVADRLFRQTGTDRLADGPGLAKLIAGPCVTSIGVAALSPKQLSDPRMPLAYLGDTLNHTRSLLLDSELNYPGEKALRDLPAPVLGALDTCIGGSPLSLGCVEIARSIADRATDLPAAERQARVARIDEDVEHIACAALDLPAPGAARPAEGPRADPVPKQNPRR